MRFTSEEQKLLARGADFAQVKFIAAQEINPVDGGMCHCGAGCLETGPAVNDRRQVPVPEDGRTLTCLWCEARRFVAYSEDECFFHHPDCQLEAYNQLIYSCMAEQDKNQPANPGYHLRKIIKGQFGEVSKIREELEELEDAAEQGVKIMVLCELSDLYGAIEAFAASQGVTMKDLENMNQVTARAFQSGRRF